MKHVMKDRYNHIDPNNNVCKYFDCIIGNYICQMCKYNKSMNYKIDNKIYTKNVSMRMVYSAKKVILDIECLKEEEEKLKKLKEILNEK